MKKQSRKQNLDLLNNRVRFNWGYHDGAWETEKGNDPICREQRCGSDWQQTHHDPIYVIGWQMGKQEQENGYYRGDSTEAWNRSGLTDGIEPFRN